MVDLEHIGLDTVVRVNPLVREMYENWGAMDSQARKRLKNI